MCSTGSRVWGSHLRATKATRHEMPVERFIHAKTQDSDGIVPFVNSLTESLVPSELQRPRKYINSLLFRVVDLPSMS